MTDQMIMADVLRLHGHSEEEIWSKMPAAVEVSLGNTCAIVCRLILLSLECGVRSSITMEHDICSTP